jgi:hypothetical protein
LLNNFFQPVRKLGVFKLFLIVLPITCILFVFINPSKLDASDFLLIAWNPAQELLKSGSVSADYPYPIWTVLIMLPFVVWSPQVSMLLWFVANLFMLAGSLAVLIDMLDWEISPALLAFVSTLSIFFLPVLTSMWLGQLSIFSLLILALTLHFFLSQKWIWLGVIVGLSFVKPQVMILLVGLLLLWSLLQRRWQVWLGFGVVIFIFIIISLPFISTPNQIIGGGISSHLSTYIERTSTIWGLLLSIGSSWLIPALISFGLLIWLGWIWLPVLLGKGFTKNRIFFLFSSAILVNLIAIPYSWMHNLLLLILPCGYCITLILKMKSRSRFFGLVILFIVMHPLMVSLFIVFHGPTLSQAYQIIPAIILTLILILLEWTKNTDDNIALSR